MKKPLLFLWLAASCINIAYSQNCNVLIKDGDKIDINITSWTNPLLSDAKFAKAKDEKKNEQIIAYNQDVASGKIQPASKYPMTYTAKKTTLPEGDEYTMSTMIAGKEYNSYMMCTNDTMYLVRNRGPIMVPDGKGGIYGYSIQGVQKIPQKLKVGDLLPSYEDISIVLPTTTDEKVKAQVFSRNSTSTSHEFGFATDSRTGETGFGNYTKTTTKAVYNTIEVNVRKTLSYSGHIINYMQAEVTGEEEVTVNGVKHKGYIIESETWSKSKMDVDFESANEAVNKQQEAFYKKGGEKVAKMMVKKGFTNELGYMVFYKKETFVPNLGMVKIESYDMNGGIASRITLGGLE